MRETWQRVFTALDETGPTAVSSSGSDNPVELRQEAADRATLDTAGLTLRAVAVAHRLGANTVEDLLDLRLNEVRKARGLSRKTRDVPKERFISYPPQPATATAACCSGGPAGTTASRRPHSLC